MLDIFGIALSILKVSIARARWGELTEKDELLVSTSSFGKLMGACYIRTTSLSPWSCNTLE